jgi:hypothetical protein
MVFIPSKRLLSELQSVEAGIWLIEDDDTKKGSIVVKIRTTDLKSVYRGIPFYIMLAIVKTENQFTSFVGYLVADDPEYPSIATALLDNQTFNQARSLRSILSESCTRLHFFDEQNRSLVSANCLITKPDVDAVNTSIMMAKGINFAAHLDQKQRSIAHDRLTYDLISIRDGGKAENTSPVFLKTKLYFDDLNIISNVASVTVENYQLDNANEGLALEESAYLALSRVFKEQTYHSPIVPEKKTSRELTDVLGFDDKYICLLESKALSLLKTELNRTSSRKASLIEHDLRKGISQAKGAIKKLKEEQGIFFVHDRMFTVPNTETATIHGIVLISEMYPFLDWKKIAEALRRFSDPEKKHDVTCN